MAEHPHASEQGDMAPGEEHEESIVAALLTYTIGLALAGGLTVAAFAILRTNLIYAPGIPVALVALAIAQMGVHLVFFLHISSGPDNVNNALALAFGTLIVGLVLIGSLWIMAHLNANMMPMEMNMQMDRGI